MPYRPCFSESVLGGRNPPTPIYTKSDLRRPSESAEQNHPKSLKCRPKSGRDFSRRIRDLRYNHILRSGSLLPAFQAD